MPEFTRDGLTFFYREAGEGLPFVFQHGLGGDSSRAFAGYSPQPGIRLIGFDARGHGETRPLGPPDRLRLATFADDLIGLMDHLGIEKAVIGGISMGAALTLNATLRYPHRVLGLVQSRPAWLDLPYPDNIRYFPPIASFLRHFGAAEGRKRFEATPEFERVKAESADVAQVLLDNFAHPRAEETWPKFVEIPLDCPLKSLDELAAIAVPTLVIGCRPDPVHPYHMAEALGRSIPKAELVEVTPKVLDEPRHNADVQREISGWLDRHFLRKA